jgi:DNA polymerase III epsilon subunit-like protein
LVQIGAILFDDDDALAAELNVIVRPQGWKSSKGAEAQHGISTPYAEKFGVPHYDAFVMFEELVANADTIVGHNLWFDKKVIERAAYLENSSNTFAGKDMHCTMLSSVNVLKLPKQTKGKHDKDKKRVPRGFKWPNLQECSMYYLGQPFENAHDAMVDVRITAQVYFVMKEMEVNFVG